MFKDIRLQHSLTREQLAERINRSVNYVLKAEQLTPTSPPTALVEFWSQQGYDRNLLKAEYRQQQRLNRQRWLDYWVPANEPDIRPGISFRRMWHHSHMEAQEQPLSGSDEFSIGFQVGFQVGFQRLPTQYELSLGLCLPPAAINRNERNPNKVPSIMLVALDDLMAYIETGRIIAEHAEPDLDFIELHSRLRRVYNYLAAKATNTAVSSNYEP